MRDSRLQHTSSDDEGHNSGVEDSTKRTQGLLLEPPWRFMAKGAGGGESSIIALPHKRRYNLEP